MTAQIDDVTSDERVGTLLEALGDLPGILVLSIGSGKSGSNPRQGRPADQFCIDFNVDVLAGGWRSLNILVFATSQTDDFENFFLRARPNTDEPTDCVSFRLRGIKRANPDELADAIERVLAGDYSGHDEPSRQQGGRPGAKGPNGLGKGGSVISQSSAESELASAPDLRGRLPEGDDCSSS